MVDITPKIKDAIRRAHANSWYAYPAAWSSFPVCAFYLAGHGDYGRRTAGNIWPGSPIRWTYGPARRKR